MRVFARLSSRRPATAATGTRARSVAAHGGRRRAGITASLAATSLMLTGCEFSLDNSLSGITQFFGPEPETALVELAFSAEDEAAAFAETNPALSELRAQQAGVLFDEIARVCGHYPDGTAPETCEVDRTERSGYGGNHEIADSAEQSLDQLLDSVPQAPEQSRALLIEQAVMLALQIPDHEHAITAVRDELLVEDATAPDSWSEMADWEYRLGYGLEAARAFLDGDAAVSTDDAAAHSDARLATLRELGIDMPQRALAYHTVELATDHPEELDDDNAAAFVDNALQQTSQQWKHQALDAKDAGWRKLAVLFAAVANPVVG